MTVCIAAACREGNEKRIVLCTDARVSSALGSAETGRKCKWLRRGWGCLTAGTEGEIAALVRLYEASFKDDANISASAIDASIKGPLSQRKKALAEEYIRHRFAMSHDEFLQFGKERLPAEVFFDAVQQISKISLEAELIIAGFIDRTAEIYYTDSQGRARAATHFAIVGEGEYVASSALLRRQQDDFTSLENTIYNVFEAKKLAQAVGSVGQYTFLAVIREDGSVNLTSLEVDRQLEKLFEKYGPPAVPNNLKFEGEYFYKKT